jgi:hypothetical protein
MFMFISDYCQHETTQLAPQRFATLMRIIPKMTNKTPNQPEAGSPIGY